MLNIAGFKLSCLVSCSIVRFFLAVFANVFSSILSIGTKYNGFAIVHEINAEYSSSIKLHMVATSDTLFSNAFKAFKR